jgi:CDC45-like protein
VQGGPPDSGPGSLESAFWQAVDALSEGHWETLREGIAHAQKLQRCISAVGGRAITSHNVANAGSFRLLNLSGASSGSGSADSGGGAIGGGEATLLVHPMALLKLALFVQEAVHVSKPRSPKPLLMVAPAPVSAEEAAAHAASGGGGGAMVLLVGVASPPKLSDAVGNRFALCFRSAAQAVGAPFVHDAFESAVLRLSEASLPSFLEQLSAELTSLP